MGITEVSSPYAECQTSLVHDDLVKAIVKVVFQSQWSRKLPACGKK